MVAQAAMMTRRRAKKFLEDAEKDPAGAALRVRAFALFASHRATLLEERRFVFWRRKHRISRMLSLATQLPVLAEMLDEMAVTNPSS